MLHEVLRNFNIIPDYDLKIMKKNQTLFDISSKLLNEIELIYDEVKPDIVLVHGDTTTAFMSALAAFYKKIDVGHIEAGLRTNDIYSPFPEELNRQAISLIAKYHFAPTVLNRKNLIKLGVKSDNIFVTGNTSIDVLNFTVEKDFNHEILDWKGTSNLILLTAHRREILGSKLHEILVHINNFIIDSDNFKLVYPVHPNPLIKKMAYEIFKNNDKVLLTEPLETKIFHNIIAKSFCVITDSGGIQEEAPGLNIPVLVLRDLTERQEAIEAGTIKLLGTEGMMIIQKLKAFINNPLEISKMVKSSNPYGDGSAARKIIEILKKI
jgi:UDP-N-acetylglucosamine 2-epimerase (non-hydrolysing)